MWGFLAGLLGVFVARKVKAAWARLHTKLDAHAKHVDEHNEWVADHLAAIHRKQGLGEPEPHPHFDLPAGKRSGVAMPPAVDAVRGRFPFILTGKTP